VLLLWSGIVLVFGCRHDVAIRALRRPATEKRQGTKSREVWRRRSSECCDFANRYWWAMHLFTLYNFYRSQGH
jgi:hypothetical protein